ncbi:hypothetical protein [Texcoconibacillus texcoconensis]|uniref:Permease n=1 Tax=Texcoconibacillus texcoconensis TaxID=1095777 RepID=A0A840QNH1_9BACI|nr:hypothetical protein [Texcoconibacillus texcoconensis]MBB5172924.1 hypothetical protein [Texcoconibacillus texcoconensis]
MKKRWQLLLGVGGLFWSARFFQGQPFYSSELIWASLVFSPDSWLWAIIAFIISFYCMSRVIKKVHFMKGIQRRRMIFLLISLGVVLIVVFHWFALLSITLSLFYGIMDAREERKFHSKEIEKS